MVRSDRSHRTNEESGGTNRKTDGMEFTTKLSEGTGGSPDSEFGGKSEREGRGEAHARAGAKERGRDREMAYVDVDLLIAVVGGLGKVVEEEEDEGKIYQADQDCVNCLKDLQRFLRRDDPYTRDAFHMLCTWNVPKNHILPILKGYHDQFEYAYNALKIMVFLTMPLDAESEEKNKQAEHLRNLKQAMVEEDVIAIVTSMLHEPLSKHPKMKENDAMIVQLVLAFFRNLLCIADSERSTDYMNRNEEVMLERLFQENVMELVLVITQHCTQKPFSNDTRILLEIHHRVFGKIKPYELVVSALKVEDDEGRNGRMEAGTSHGDPYQGTSVQDDALKNLIQAERGQRMKAWSAIPTRHSRFGGVYASKHHYGGIGTSIVRDNPRRSDAIYAPCGRVRAPSRKRVALENTYSVVRPKIAKLLRDYADQFLENCYAIFMEKIFADEIRHGLGLARFQEEDFERFYALARFFTGYLRAKLDLKMDQRDRRREAGEDVDESTLEEEEDSPFAPISVTMTKSMFGKVINLWRDMQEIPVSHEEKNWSLQSSAQGLVVQMLHALQQAYLHGTKADQKAADALQRALLFDDMKESGLLPLLSRSVKQFDHAHQTSREAADLIDGVHIALLTLDSLVERESGKLLVLRRKRRQRKKAVPDKDETATQGATEDANKAPAPQQPPVEPQSPTVSAGRRMVAEAIEDESEDEPETMEVELNINKRFKQEFASPLVVNHYLLVMKEYKQNPVHVNDSICHFLTRLAVDCNLAPMLWQLRFLDTVYQILNDKSIRSDDKYTPLLMFCTKLVKGFFRQLMPPAALEPSLLEEDGGDPEELTSAAERNAVLQKKAEVSASQLLFVEVMFWKHARDASDIQQRYGWVQDLEMDRRMRGTEVGGDLAYAGDALGEDEMNEIVEGIDEEVPGATAEYGKQKKGSGKANRGVKSTLLTDEQEGQLRVLHERYKESEDAAALIAANMNGDFTTLQISKKLRDMGLEVPENDPVDGMGPTRSRKRRGKFSEEKEEELRRLFQELQGTKSIYSTIAARLGEGFTSRNVSHKARQMGLSQPAAKKEAKRRRIWAELSDGDDESQDNSEDRQRTEGSDDMQTTDQGGQSGSRPPVDESSAQQSGLEELVAQGEQLEEGGTSSKRGDEARKEDQKDHATAPTFDEKLRTKALEILESANLDVMTVKLLRQTLESHFQIELLNKKDLIKDIVTQYIQAKAKELKH